MEEKRYRAGSGWDEGVLEDRGSDGQGDANERDTGESGAPAGDADDARDAAEPDTDDAGVLDDGRTSADGDGRSPDRTGHAIGRRSVLQVLTALGGIGAFSGAASASVDDAGGVDPMQMDEDDGPVGTEELLAYLAAKYGDVLTDEQIAELEGDVAGNVETAGAIDAVDLRNGEDMALSFEPFRGSWD